MQRKQVTQGIQSLTWRFLTCWMWFETAHHSCVTWKNKRKYIFKQAYYNLQISTWSIYFLIFFNLALQKKDLICVQPTRNKTYNVQTVNGTWSFLFTNCCLTKPKINNNVAKNCSNSKYIDCDKEKNRSMQNINEADQSCTQPVHTKTNTAGIEQYKPNER